MTSGAEEVSVTVAGPGDAPGGRVTRRLDGGLDVEVLDESARPLVEAVAARMGAPRAPRPRPGCVDAPPSAG